MEFKKTLKRKLKEDFYDLKCATRLGIIGGVALGTLGIPISWALLSAGESLEHLVSSCDSLKDVDLDTIYYMGKTFFNNTQIGEISKLKYSCYIAGLTGAMGTMILPLRVIVDRGVDTAAYCLSSGLEYLYKKIRRK